MLFSNEYYDLVVPSHDDPLFRTNIVVNFEVFQIFVDQVSLANVLFYDTLRKISIMRFNLIPHCRNLIRLIEDQMQSLDQDELQVTLRQFPLAITIKEKFLEVDYHSTQNVKHDKSIMNTFGEVPLIVHLVMSFTPTLMRQPLQEEIKS